MSRRVYRSRSAAVVMVVCGVLAPVAISLPALLDPGEMSRAAQAFFVLLGLVMGAIAIRCAVCAVHVEDAGVRIVNPFATIRVAWADIAEFTLARWGLLPRNCVVRLADGSKQGVWAISARNPNVSKHDSAAEGLVTELNGWLRLSRAPSA